MAKKKMPPSARATGVVLLKTPGEDWQELTVPIHRRKGITYKTLQGLVGGFYEQLGSGAVSLIVNERGRLLNLPPCIAIGQPGGDPLVLVGPVVVVANYFNRNGVGFYHGLEPEFISRIITSPAWIPVS